MEKFEATMDGERSGPTGEHASCRPDIALRQSEESAKARTVQPEGAREALFENEWMYRILVERVSDGIAIIQDGLVRYANPKLSEMVGHSETEIFARPFTDFVHADEIQAAMTHHRNLPPNEDTTRHETLLTHKSGSNIHVELTIATITFKERPAELMVIRDITERRQAEKLMQHRLRFDEAIGQASRLLVSPEEPDLGRVLKTLGEAIGVNRAYLFRLKVKGQTVDTCREWCAGGVPSKVPSAEDVRLWPWWATHISRGKDIIVADIESLPPEAATEMAALKSRGVRSFLVVTILSNDGWPSGFLEFDDTSGAHDWIREDVRALKIIAEIVGIFWDKKAADEKLSQTISQYTEMINTVPASMYMKDINHRYLAVNDAFCRLAGRSLESIVGKTDVDIFNPARAQIHYVSDQTVMREDRKIVGTEEVWTDPAGTELRVSNTKVPIHDGQGKVTGVVGLTQDITEQHRRREQLIQSDKLAAIGILAAGVAHEINNPVGYINSNLNTMAKYVDKIKQYLNETGPADPSRRQQIDELLDDFHSAIQESAQGTVRVRNIVADLKSFSRTDQSATARFNLNDGISSTLNIVWNELKYKCRVEKDLHDLPDLFGVATQLNQVFMNLFLNASQAIVGDQGVIKIKTWADEKNVYITVADNGCGIARENLQKIFEPFFTTKEVGKGTGLGLSLSFDIVKKHNGTIDVRSEVGVGTEFIITLPHDAGNEVRTEPASVAVAT